jgi:integrase
MKQRSHDHKVQMVTVRASLTVRREPYWRDIGERQRLGFRKTPSGPGTWIARWTDAASRYHYRALGRADALAYEDAEKAAQDWFAQCRGGVVRAGTVEDACKQYVENQRNEKGDPAADTSDAFFTRTVHGTPTGQTPLDRLTTRDVEHWRDALVTGARSKRTVNRLLRSLKAALNFGFQRSMCPTDAAWRRVKALKGKGAKDKQRAAFLSPAERSKLLAMCDSDKSGVKNWPLRKADAYDLVEWATPELGNLMRGLLYTAARPNELASATVKDFDPTHKRLALSSLKGLGEERRRDVPLSPNAVEFFKARAKDKLPAAPLLSIRGEAWQRHMWSRGIRAALKAINSTATEPADRLPAETVAYTMRHCAISDWLKAGLDVGSVAKISGTSIGMISTYYFKYIQTDVADKLANVQSF